MIKQNIIAEVICFLLVLLFVYAALSKLFDYNSFQNQIQKSQYIFFTQPVAWMIPAAELLIAGLLTFKATRTQGLYASFFLMLLFTVYIVCMLLFSKHLPCSCGGVLKQMTWQQHLLFNIFFMMLSITGIIVRRKFPDKNIVV